MRAPSLLRARLRAHARLRYPLVALAAGLALVSSCAAGAPPQRSVEAIAAALGRAAGGEVSPDDFVWEARGGFLADAFLGRRVLFLARRADTGQRDLHRARVRLTRNGHPLSVDVPRDLTDTPLDDDGDLLAFGRWAAFANRGEGVVRSVTVLDLQGEPGGGLAARAERWLDTGSARGLGRQEIAFLEPPADVRFEITGDEVVLALGAERSPALLDARSAVLTGTAGADHGARAYRLPASPPSSLFAVWPRLAGRVAGAAVGRAASAIGEAARTFAARVATVTVRAPSRLDDWSDAAPAPSATGGASWPPAALTPPLAPPLPGEGVWVAHTRVAVAPPLPPLAPSSAPGPSPGPDRATDDDASARDAGATGPEGTRRPAPGRDAGIDGDAGIEGDEDADPDDATEADAGAAPVVEKPVADAPRPPLPPAPRPPALLRTAIRPDPSDPSTVVRLVAMDTRQVELRWQPGYARPRPLAAPYGDGALGPEHRAIAIAAFNGGPIPDAERAGASPGRHGDRALGLVFGGRAGTPPAPGAATLAGSGDAGVTFGVWPAGPALAPTAQPPLDSSARPAGSAGAPTKPSPPSRLASPSSPLPQGAGSWLRQLPDALHPVPAGPVFPLAHATLRLQRSAFGATASGHLVYAWSARATAAQLAAALRLADCVWVAPLAAAPAGVGFWFLSSPVPEGSGEQGASGAPLSPSMTLGAEAWNGASRDDFFWLAARATAPRIGDDDLRFDRDEGTQPEPTWAPAVHVVRSPHLGAQVTVTAFAAGRFTFRLGAGTREPKHRNGGAFVSDMPPGSTVIAAIGLGASRRRAPRGLATDGLTGFPFRPESGALLLADRTRPALLPSDDLTVPTGADATELPFTADDGKLRPEGREVGSMRARAAVCNLDGTFLVATTTFDSDEATTEALLELGCRRVLALDRGGHQPAFVHRAGTATPPATRYEVTALYLLAAPMQGTAHPLP